MINSCNEVYGACRHKTRFHRYTMNNKNTALMTEETPERVLGATSAKAARENLVPNLIRKPLGILQASQAMGVTVDV